jgi:hypothetical protein
MAFMYLLLASAGVGFIIALLLNSLNDYLLKKRISVVHPDTMISIDIFKTMNPVEAMKQGMYMLFLMSWVSVLGFIVFWSIPFFQEVSNYSLWIGAFLYSFLIYVGMMLVFLPLVHRGFFGVLYHPKTPYWSAALLAIYAVLLALLAPYVINILLYA